MFVVDTNILVYAARTDFEEHKTCRTLVERWRADRLPWFLTWSVVYEFLRITTHPKILQPPLPSGEAWSFIESLLESPSLDLLVETDRHAAVAQRTLHEHPEVRGNILHDTHTAILMREHGVRTIYTRDRDFKHFPFVEAIDPLKV